MTTTALSVKARTVIVMDAIVVVLLWFAWSPLLFVWHTDYTSVSTMALVILVLATRGLRKSLVSESASDAVSFRRVNYAVARGSCLAIVGGQTAVALTLHTAFVWIISAIIIVIAGALLFHEWIELRDAARNKPNQPPEPSASGRGSS
jgi:hypothetical protein